MGYFVCQATPDLVYFVSKNMRDRDFQEVNAIRWEDDREKMANGLALQYGDKQFCMCIGYDNEPIAILMGVSMHPTLWSIGFWATESFPKIKKYVTKFIANEFSEAMYTAGARRIECKSIVGYNDVHKWLKLLGFVQGDTEKHYGKNGEDFITFYWVEGMPRPFGYDPNAETEVASQSPETNQGDPSCAEAVEAKETEAQLKESASVRTG